MYKLCTTTYLIGDGSCLHGRKYGTRSRDLRTMLGTECVVQVWEGTDYHDQPARKSGIGKWIRPGYVA